MSFVQAVGGTAFLLAASLAKVVMHMHALVRFLFPIFMCWPAISFPSEVCAEAPVSEIRGTARAIDGDDLVVSTGRDAVRVRLCGIDAPERHWPAVLAKITLAARVDGRIVSCVPVGHGTPCDGRSRPKAGARIVAQCFVDGLDIGGEMVRLRVACDWSKFSGGHYIRKFPNGRSCDTPW